MKKVIAWAKNIRLRQILMTFLAGVLLFVSTACNIVQAQSPKPGTPGGQGQAENYPRKNPRPEVPGGTATDPRPEVVNKFQGGMNDFNDRDPRAEEAAADIKAQADAVKASAQRNVIDETSDVGTNTKRILEKKGQNAEELGRNLNRSGDSSTNKTQNSSEDFGEGTKRGLQNIKENVQKAPGYFNQQAKETGDYVGNIKPTTFQENAPGREMKQAGHNLMSGAKETGNDFANRAENAVEGAGDYVQSKASQAAKTTQRNLEKAGNAIQDAVD